MKVFVRALISWLGLVFLGHSRIDFFRSLQPNYPLPLCPWDEHWYFDRQAKTWKTFDPIPF